MSRVKHEGRLLYEGLFMMTQSAADLSASLDKVREILDRAEAELVSLRKWDERKLAYPVQGQKRATYLLALFRVDGPKITQIERDCHLSEEVLRVLITRGEHLGETEIEQELKEAQGTADEAAVRGEGEGEGEGHSAQTGAGAGAESSSS